MSHRYDYAEGWRRYNHRGFSAVERDPLAVLLEGAGTSSMENKMWNGSYYLNYWEPESGRKSDLVFGYQLGGQWVAGFHRLPGVFRAERVKTTLETIKRCNVALSKTGASNYAHADGSPAPGAVTALTVTFLPKF